jgi:beta-lactamase regulating signal transducer with metallopeptidase domain/protocatechuate 3,4-dioxygenase beta subunit
MIFLISCAIKVSFILSVTLLAVRLLRTRSAALRHCVLAAGIFFAAITPGLSLIVPSWTWHVIVDPPPPPPAARDVGSDAVSPSNPQFIPMPLPRPSETPPTASSASPATPALSTFSYRLSASETLLLIWSAGFAISFLVLLSGFAHLGWITRGSHSLNSEEWNRVAEQVARVYALPRSPRLLQSEGLSVLFTWGWRRPRILVPAAAPSWPMERIHAVLCHELAHIRRGDWIVQMAAELVRAVYWFNPLFWIACRRLRRESEQACDDAALSAGIKGSDYAAHVLDVVKSLREPKRNWSYALSIAGPSTLEQRFKAILDPALNRAKLTRVSLAAIFAGFVFLTLPLSALRGSTATESALLLPGFPAAPVPPEAWQQTPPATPVGPGIVQGAVRRKGSGEPIPGVEISLEGGPADQTLVDLLVRGVAGAGIIFKPSRIGTIDELMQEALDAAGARGVGPGFPLFQNAINEFQTASAGRFTTVSDRDGRFAIRNVPGGEYRVRAEREGFFGDAASENFPSVTVTPNQSAETTVLLSSGGVMSGRVLDAAGRPVQDANVDALALTYENGYPVLRAAVTKTTDDQGEYRLFWLVPGEYYIQVTVPASPGSGGQPLRTFYPAAMDTSGATPLVVRSDDKLSGLDIQVKTSRLPRLSGVVTTTIPAAEMEKQGALYNAALARPSLLLVSRDTNRPDVTGGGARVIGTVALNNGSGKFETQGVLPGSYILLARMPADNAAGGAGFAFGRINVDVGNDDISGLSIAVHRSVNVTGRVTVDGRVPQNVPVRLALRVDDSGMKIGIYQTQSQRFATADANGAFTVIGIVPGPYHIDVGPGLPKNLYVSDVRQGARSVFDSGFEIGSEVPDPLQVAVSSGAGTVEGVVVDASGKPVNNATVVLAPPENRRQNRLLFHQAVTDKTGRFSLHNIAPGTYKLFGWQQPLPPSTWFNEGFMARYEAQGRAINVGQDSKVTQQITVIP